MKEDEKIGEDLEGKGYSTHPHFLSLELAVALRADLLKHRSRFQEAGIGKKSFRAGEIRKDETHWLSDAGENDTQASFLRRLHELKETLNQKLFLGLWNLEGHYAVYGPGAFYRKHVDRFQDDSKRVVSVVCFFNEGWKESEGGLLRLESPKESRIIDVLPESGTLVCFLSDQIPHEVTETYRERLSYAGWFKRR